MIRLCLPLKGGRTVTCAVLVTFRLSDVGIESWPTRSLIAAEREVVARVRAKLGNFLFLSMISHDESISQEPVPRHRCLGAKEKARRLVSRACV